MQLIALCALFAAPDTPNPDLEPAAVTPCEARIQTHLGAPSIWVDGEPQAGYAYLTAFGDTARLYPQMAEAGVRIFSVSGGMGITPEGFDPSECDAPFLEVLEARPDALIFPRVGVTPPQWWLDANPDERVVLDDGSVGPQSMFSRKWLDDACEWVERYSRYIRSSPYANHVLGIHICSGVTAEWQSWGLWSNRRGDFSRPARDAWRAYLRDKYGSDEALSAAWGRSARIDEAEVPSRERRETDAGLLRDPVAFRDVSDFYDFYWRGPARAIEELAAAAKRGGGRDWLVGFFYGYQIMYGGKAQESQHLGLRKVIESPDIDFLCSPAMYLNRGPGEASTFMSMTRSIQARNKLWWDEADNRTHLAIGGQFGEVAPALNLFESVNVLKREFAHTAAAGAAIWWFDMAGGWYDDPAMLDLHGRMSAYSRERRDGWTPEVEVAVFVDDKSTYRMAPESYYLGGVTALLAWFPQAGVPYHTYLLSDIDRAADYKVCFFPVAFDLTNAERAAIESLKSDGRTLVFFGPAGIGRYEDGLVTLEDPALSDALVAVSREGEGVRAQDHCDWRSVWAPLPGLMPGEVRPILRDAGVHVYSSEDDAFYVGNGFAALHAQEGGEKTLVFPEEVRAVELLTDEPLSHTGRRLTIPLQTHETRCFRIEAP